MRYFTFSITRLLDSARFLLYQGEMKLAEAKLEGTELCFSGLTLPLARLTTLTLTTELSKEATSGHALFLELTSLDVGKSVATITCEATKAYILGLPQGFVVDGLFGEWLNPKEDLPGDTEEPNIDITHYDTATQGEMSFFYLKVAGKMLAGSFTPVSRAMALVGMSVGSTDEPVVTTQEETPLPVESGEDAVYVFLDTNGKVPHGYRVREGFYADKMIEILGINGEIRESRLMEFSGENARSWSWIFQSVAEVGVGTRELETRVVVRDVSDVAFHVVGWDEKGDYAFQGPSHFVKFRMDEDEEYLSMGQTRNGGKTIIVDINGNGNYTTITAGIAAASSGDTVRVWAGTYEETINVKSGVSLIGNGTSAGKTMIIDEIYGWDAAIVKLNSGSLIKGFELENTHDEAEALVISSWNSGKMENLHINDGGIGFYLRSNNELRGISLSGCDGDGIHIYGKENYLTGIEFDVYSDGIQLQDGEDCYKNVFEDISGSASAIFNFENGGVNNEIRNCSLGGGGANFMSMESQFIYNSSFKRIWCASGSMVTMINSSATTISIDDEDSKLFVKNYLTVETEYNNGNPIANADVRVKDNDDVIYASSHFSGTDPKTDTDGLVKSIVVTDKVYNGSNDPTENITTVTVWKSGITFSNNDRNVSMATTHTESFEGIPEFRQIVVPVMGLLVVAGCRKRRKDVRLLSLLHQEDHKQDSEAVV